MTTIHDKRAVPLVLPLRCRGFGLRDWLGCVVFGLWHLAALALYYTGTSVTALVLFAVCYFVQMFGITAGYHRYFSHRAYKTSRGFQFLLAGLGCVAFQKGPLWWVGHHRHHHRYADTEEDLHSPRSGSFLWSHVGWALAPDYNETNWAAVRDWSRYPELRLLNLLHWLPPFALATLCFLIGGWSGLVWGFLIATLATHHATFTVNSICHVSGRRRYATSDNSRNNVFVAVITLGEGWHNNHHHYQSSANQGFYWWEIDVSYYLIWLLGCLGLVWDIRKAPCTKVLSQAEKQETPAGNHGTLSVIAMRASMIFPEYSPKSG